MAFGHCEYHDYISINSFKWKGCWSCWRFCPGNEYDLIDVNETAKELKMSQSTVRRLIKMGELQAELYMRGRPGWYDGAYRKLFIKKKDLEDF